MSSATTLTTIWFSVLVAATAAIAVAGLRRSGWNGGAIAALFAAYLAIPGILARTGTLDRYTPLPSPPLILLLGLTLTTVLLARSAHGARIAAGVPLAAIVLLQGFRIPVELLLHRLYLEGAIPIQMTYSGRNWDIVSGLTGIALGIWLLRDRPAPRALILGWNVLGLGLLINIVAVAVLSTPTPFRRFVEGPPNLLPSSFPFIWLPSFLVQVALGSHLILFRRLLRPPPASAPAATR